MAYINENYLKLPGNYLFAEVARRVAAFRSEHPDAEIIRLGIGDVTLPLPAVSIEAMHAAVDEMAKKETFRGYGPEQGYDFLIDAIIERNYASRGLKVERDEVFVSDGSKSDCGNIQEIFSSDAVVAITDPVYPVYLDTNVMAGRTGEKQDNGYYAGVTYLPSTAANHFSPSLPTEHVDIIYLCCPNNPTGTTLSRDALTKWVEYAKKEDAVILFDAAYAAYITEPDVPRSIYEIPGAKDVAIEFRSFSKTAGFTGTRCGYCVVPNECRAFDASGAAVPLQPLWKRRQSTKFNGVSYPVQRAAEAACSPEGRAQCKALIDGYLANAKIVIEHLEAKGFRCTGGRNSPYVWFDCGTDSWAFFDRLLREANVVTTPGVGFGRAGAGHVRITAFNSRENVERAMERLDRVL